MTWVLFIMLWSGDGMRVDALERYTTIEGCLEAKAVVMEEMKKQYPEDVTTQFVCVQKRVDKEA